MRLLIVDNQSRYINRLEKVLAGYDTTTIPFHELNPETIRHFSAAILSGGRRYTVMGNEDVYEAEMDMIRGSKIPILGICLGFQLICRSFGAEISRLPGYVRGVKKIHQTRDDPIFGGVPELSVFKYHRWHVEKAKDLVPLAGSEMGIEAVRHPERLMYGVQFHPEVQEENSNGYKILENFLRMAASSCNRSGKLVLPSYPQ